MSIDFLVTSLIIIIVSPGTGVLYTLAAGLSRGSRASLPQFVSSDEPHPLSHMLVLSAFFMLLTFAVFVGYGLFAAAIRSHVISRPRVLTWMRRAFTGAFVALGAKLALAER